MLLWHAIARKIKEEGDGKEKDPFPAWEKEAGLYKKDRKRRSLLKEPYFQGARIFCLRNRLIQRHILSRAASRK